MSLLRGITYSLMHIYFVFKILVVQDNIHSSLQAVLKVHENKDIFRKIETIKTA